MRRWIVVAAACCIGLTSYAAPTNDKGADHKQPRAKEQRGTASNPIAVKLIQPQQTAEQAKADQDERTEKRASDQRMVDLTDEIARFTGYLVIVGGVQAAIFILQLIVLGAQAHYLRQSIEDTGKAADAAKSSADAVMLSERAYVQMSHVLPGVVREEDRPGGTFSNFHVRFKIKNFGRTPALVTDVKAGGLVLDWEELLDVNPPFRKVEIAPNALLMPQGELDWERLLSVQRNLGDAAWMGTRRLWVYGYVDYRDAFGVRHRSGWVRFYNGDAKTDNLLQTAEGRYDYDRPRQRGEGNDWGDS